MTREEAIKELERISEDTVQRDCSTCGRHTAGTYNGVCCYCSLCQVVPDIFKDYHERKHFRSHWKWNGAWKNDALHMAIAALKEQPRWISVVGNDRYMVNRYGDVMNAETGMILKQAKNKAGYRIVVLHDPIYHQRKTTRVHRIAAEAFIEHPH